MSVPCDFLKSCITLPTGEDFYLFFEAAVKSIASIDLEKECTNIKNYLKSAYEADNIQTIGAAITTCQAYCNKKLERIPNFKNDSELSAFIKFLSFVSQQIDKIATESTPALAPDEVDYSSTLESYDDKIKELNRKLDGISGRIDRQEETIDSKVFQLLISMVTILGVFVAIAFAGFGGVSLLSNISIVLSDDYLRGLASVFLLALFIYNLLFILIHFMIVVLKTYIPTQKDITKPNYIFFKWFDIILLVLTLIFICLSFFS